MRALQLTAFVLSVLTLGSFLWAALFYFKTADGGASNGKRLITFLGGAGILLNLVWIYKYPKNDVTFLILGTVLYLVSFFIFWWATISFGTSRPSFAGSNKSPMTINTRGPYRWVRHPFYSSYTIAWMAGAITSNWLLLVYVLVMYLVYLKMALNEEALILSGPSSEEYLEYKRHSGMFLPLKLNGFKKKKSAK